MKTKYIIVSLIAAIGLLMTGCVEEADHFLDEVKVSSSYLAFPAGGGSVPTELTATGAWTITALPEWVSVSPTSGGAGTTTVTFTATAATDSRDATAKIECGGKTQNINLLQVTEKSEPVTMTVKQALAVIAPLADQEVAGGTYRVKGIVCKIDEISAQYGNATYYLSDDGSFTAGNWLEVYRGLWLNGASITKGDEFSVGDELTIEGSLMNYKGTPETKEKTAIVVAVKKSLISVDAFSFNELPYTDTTFNMVVTAKESPLLVNCDADWLQITDVNKDGSYKLHAEENTRTAKRSASITIKGPTALKTIQIVQAGAPSTGASVTEIIAAADNDQVQTLPTTVVVALTSAGAVLSDGTSAIYAYGEKAAALKVGDGVKLAGTKTTYNGVPEIKDITDVFVDSEGNAVEHPNATDITANVAEYTASVAEYVKLSGTLTVSTDGKYYNMEIDGVDPATKQGSISSPAESLNAKSFDGKKITVTGYFNGLSGKGKYVNVIATKIDEYVDNPKGTATNPYTPSEIATLLTGGTTFDEDVYIKGIVSAILYEFSTYNGTGTFWLSDDGTFNGSEDKKSTTDFTHDFECYGLKWFGNEVWTEGKAQVQVGDEVVVCGKTTLYKGVAETDSKKGAWLYSVNGATTDVNGLGNAVAPFNIAGAVSFIDACTAATEAAKAADQPAPTFPDVCVKGKISKIQSAYSVDYGTAIFWISDDGEFKNDNLKDFEAYSLWYFGGKSWAEGDKQIELGDEVVIKGQLTYYAKNKVYETLSKKASLYSLNGATE
ncbi:MAG: BACON domain-containing protein [Bacteroidales bacterium]|nr:BACON domain-containing protein [Bacteroidales bacterium]